MQKQKQEQKQAQEQAQEQAQPQAAAATRRPDTAIALDGVRKSYGARSAVDALDLRVRRGETLALLGPNGAGKSTTVGLLTGLLVPDAGRVTVAGDPPRRAVARGAIAAMLQDSGLMPGVTVGELVELAGRFYPHPLSTPAALELAGLTALARRRVDRLSGGQAQRVRFALVAGASGFLLKDLEPDELRRAVRVVAAGEALLAPSVTRRLIAEYTRRGGGAGPGTGARPGLDSLTEREREVLVLVARGLSNDEIATRLFISPATAKTHVSHAMTKLSARDRAQLVVFAYESDLV